MAMAKSRSSPSVGRNSFSEAFSPDFDRSRLPLGVSSAMASRMRLDATLDPNMIRLRMNNQNLRNEMMLHKGKIVSNQFALMRPRPKNYGKPKALELPGNHTKQQADRMSVLIASKNSEPDSNEDVNKDQSKPGSLPSSPAASRPTSRPASRPGSALSQSGSPGSQKSFFAGQHKTRRKLQRLRRSKSDVGLQVDVSVTQLLKDGTVEAVYRPLEENLPSCGTGMPHDKVSRALVALGFKELDEEYIREVVSQVATGGPLSLDEFAKVVVVFEKQRSKDLLTKFREVDKDDSGSVNVRELRHLLWDMGYTVTLEAVDEIVREVDDNASGEVDFPEFAAAIQVIHKRRGFTKQESSELYALFDRYDMDASGEITADELAGLLGYFGTPTSIKQAMKIIQSFDENGDGMLGRSEFLAVMRIRLEDEISDLRTLFAEFDTDHSGTIDSSEVLPLVHSLGYSVEPDVIEEIISDVVKHRGILDGGLVFEDLLKVIMSLRRQEGFKKGEVQELRDVFCKHDLRGGGQLREFELARALHWLGYPLAHQRRRQYWCKVDVDKTDSIDCSEFLKYIRILREDETASAKAFLAKPSASGESSQYIREASLREMLNKLGYSPSPALVKEALQQSIDTNGDGAADLVGVLGILKFIRENQVIRLRQCCGLPDNIATKVHSKFGLRFEAGKRIPAEDVEKFMHDWFRSAAHTPGEADKIKELVLANSTDGSGTLEESEIYWVIRQYSDKNEEEKWEREQDAAKAANFSTAQVSQFRIKFVEADKDGSGLLCEQEIQGVFDNLIKLTSRQVKKLQKEINKMGDAKEAIDFPEFLRLMRVVHVSDEDL